MRSWILAVAVFVAPARDVEGWIAKLSSDQVEAREEAKQKLIDAGEKAIPALRKALEGAKDADLRARLREILARVARAQAPAGVKIEVIVPKAPPTAKQANSPEFKVTVRFTNENDFDVVLWPYLEQSVFKKDGKELDRELCIGAGIRPEGCFLKAAEWLTIEPKKSADVPVAPSYNEAEFRTMQGWKFCAGVYSLVFTSSYSRGKFVKRCPDKCRGHGDPDQPWNRALDLERTVKASLSVTD